MYAIVSKESGMIMSDNARVYVFYGKIWAKNELESWGSSYSDTYEVAPVTLTVKEE